MMDKLPEEFKKRWVAALRSGEYKQGHEQLYNEYSKKYCCLGVAGRLAGVNPAILEIQGYLTASAPGLPDILIQRPGNTVSDKLVQMNDGEEKSFREIANWIEANL